MKNKLSVIIPAHNEENYLEKTLKSLKANKFPFELVIICDSCSDKTSKIARKYAKKIYNVDFNNISKTRNFGTKKSKGDFLLFIDADTSVSKNYLSEIYNASKEYDYGCAKWISESKSVLGKLIAWNNNRYNKQHKTFSGNSFIKKSLFKKVGGFNEKMLKGEDTDLGDRLKKIDTKYVFILNAYYIPSERKYKEKGYLNLILKSQFEGFLYLFNRKKYDGKIAKVN